MLAGGDELTEETVFKFHTNHNPARKFTLGHPRHGKREDARMHCMERLLVDDTSTEIHHDDLEPCRLAGAGASVIFVDL